MNRKLVLGLTIPAIAILYLGLTWGSGYMTLNQLQAWRDKASSRIPLLKVADQKLQRGLFSSTEEVTYEVDFAPFRRLLENKEGLHPASVVEAPAPLRFTLRNRIEHGPLPGFSGFGMARIDTTLVLDEATRQQLMTSIGTDKPLEMTTTLDFLGGGTSTATSPAFRYSYKPANVNFDWKGMRSQFDFGRNMGSLKGSATMPGLRVTGPGAAGASSDAVDLGEIRLDADLKRAIGEVYTGRMSLAMAGLTVAKDGQKAPVTAKDARYDLDMTQAGDYLDMMVHMGLGELQLENTNVRDVHYDFSLRHLHGPTYAELQTRMQDAQWKSLAGDPTAGMALVGLFAEYGPRLLEHKPELAVDHIGFTLPEGSLRISGKVGLPTFAKADLQAGIPALIGKIDASMDIKVSQGLIEKDWSAAAAPDAAALTEGAPVDPQTGAPSGAMKPGMAQFQALRAQTQALEAQGFIKRTGDSLQSHIEFRNGALTVNGKPMGPPGAQ